MALGAPKATAVATSESVSALRFACPTCGRKYSTKPELAGKKIRCNGCNTSFNVPGSAGSSATVPAQGALKSFGASASPAAARAKSADDSSDDSSLLSELAAIEGVKRPKRAESVLTSRSEMMDQVRQRAAEQTAAQNEEKEEKPKGTKKKKKKKKKTSSFFDPKETLKLVAGVGVVVIVLAFLGWRFPDMRFPIGGLLCVVGFITYLMGWASIKQLVAEEGDFKALMFRFVVPYQWWFILTRWSDTKDYFAFFMAGMMILGIGGAIIKTSPIGKKAEASDREYQKARRGTVNEAPPPVVKGSDDDEN